VPVAGAAHFLCNVRDWKEPMSRSRNLLVAVAATFFAGGTVLHQTAAWAQDAGAPPAIDSGDTAWMLTSTALVLLMTIPGVALFYSGMVRKKNILATAMQSFAITALMSIIWMVVGYSLAFSDGGAGNAYVGGLSNFLLNDLQMDSVSGSIPESLFIVFQMTFAIITPALVAGSIADRMKFSALLWFLGIWSIVVYAPITHWVWGGGFLAEAGVLDFAGGTVVHINAGVAGLVAAIVLGRRTGLGTDHMAPYNLVYAVIGASLLWVGWFGFNAGSAAAANASAGMAMLVTQIATAGAALAWMFGEWIFRGKPSVLGIVSGAVAGLVAITPAAGFVGPAGALVIGITAGVVCLWAVVWLKPALGYDDSLDAFGVHAVGGIVGALLTGVFAKEAIGGTAGVLEGNGGQLITQAYGILVTIVWTAFASFVILKIIDVIIGLRVTREVEVEGLDINLHGEVIQ
jgi:Amt family ammonium transporter